MANRLALEDSPYLQQHKDNPFDWYPWCDEAFEKARIENRPIFISIGYSSCHWCHVMEHDVFENKEIASYMNTHFVCIKVDREERPDIDKHYQELHLLLNRRSGGWPLSVFCTPGNKPFYAGTYIPPFNRDNMMGFSELSAIIAQKVAENDEKLFQNADEITQYLKPASTHAQATALDLKIVSAFIKQAEYNFDSLNGGFSTSPKFPQVSTLETLLCIDRLTPDETVSHMLTLSLDHMALGGIYDLTDGGFYRYSTDESWLVPHFEKMGYDNGLLCALYTKAALQYNNHTYVDIAKNIADFMMNLMMENDLFYSASDADSEGEEGKYFIYSYDEILTSLKKAGVADTSLESAAASIGASLEGNFEGHNIIRLHSHDKPEWFDAFRDALKSLRISRAYPFIDKKAITSWNAMMIRGLFLLGKIDPSYTDSAIRSLEALLSMMLRDDTLFHSGLIGKEPKVEAFLEDYAYLAAALLEAYQATFNELYLIRAQQLSNKALELYYNQGGWYFSRGDFATIAELDDGTYPSALAVMVESLLTLGSLVDDKYRHFAFKTLEYHSLKLMKSPVRYPKFTEQVIRYLHETRIVKVPQSLVSQCPVHLNYPFVLLKKEPSENQFMICGDNSCFSATADATQLDDLIQSSL